MLRLLKLRWFFWLLVGATPMAWGFSLLGPFDTTYQTPDLGYNPPDFGYDLGGPMWRTEGYRWNVPVITYAFDSTFLDYFGSNGVAAVEQAFQTLNDIPAASEIDLSKYPTDTLRINYQASALGLYDLKSQVLATLLEEMGLAGAERFAWCLRSRFIDSRPTPAITNYYVIQRNFDPVTYSPSTYVNGTLYTYGIREFTDPEWRDAVESPVDPLAFTFTSVASSAQPLYDGTGTLATGGFFTGLTRDDVGGLRFLLSANNFKVEDLVSIPGQTVVSNANPFAMFPWLPAWIGTNLANIAALTNFPALTNLLSATNLVGQGLRPGVEKITFRRVNFDSMISQSFTPVTNLYTDVVITNSTRVTQQVERQIFAPDIIFLAGDLGLNQVGVPIFMRRSGLDNWINNATLNSQTAVAGPGVVQPQIQIQFSTLLPYFVNETPSFLNEATAFGGFAWGSFDGSTNAPIVYPADGRITLEYLEQQIFSGQQ